MRILCLHGKGTSGSIFKSQTCQSTSIKFPTLTTAASFRAHLSDLDLDFNFIDAPYPSSPAAGINLFYGPPYYSFTQDNNLDAIHASAKWLADFLAQSGPYDAVMGFSQGCHVAASYLLLHSAKTPHEPPPFKAAIFICGGAPLLLAQSLGFDISDEVWARDRVGREALTAQADSGAILAQGSARWAGVEPDGTVSEETIRDEVQGPYSIDIPTAHVYGSKDPRYTAGVQLSGLCNEKERGVFNHLGGHEIPRNSFVSKNIAELVREVLDRAR